MSENHMSENHMSENHMSENHMSENHMSDPQIPPTSQSHSQLLAGQDMRKLRMMARQLLQTLEDYSFATDQCVKLHYKARLEVGKMAQEMLKKAKQTTTN